MASGSQESSWTHYVDVQAGNAIADMLAAQRRVAQHELHSDPERADEVAAPEPDPDDAPFDLEAAPSDPDEREAFFLAACCLEVLGELPVTVPLWERALRQRETQRQCSLFGVAWDGAPYTSGPLGLAADLALPEPEPEPEAAPTSPRGAEQRPPREPATQLSLF
jgi:hypothetical protein